MIVEGCCFVKKSFVGRRGGGAVLGNYMYWFGPGLVLYCNRPLVVERCFWRGSERVGRECKDCALVGWYEVAIARSWVLLFECVCER